MGKYDRVNRNHAKTGNESEGVKLIISPSPSHNKGGGGFDIHPVGVFTTPPLSLGGGGVCTLLCKMEMSLPRFAVAKLFWNGSHQENAGQSRKIRSLTPSRAVPFFWIASGGGGVETKGLKRVFIQDRGGGGGYTDRSEMNTIGELYTGEAQKPFFTETWQ